MTSHSKGREGVQTSRGDDRNFCLGVQKSKGVWVTAGPHHRDKVLDLNDYHKCHWSMLGVRTPEPPRPPPPLQSVTKYDVGES